VATPPLHPIYRRDTFYVWFNTLDPSGYETEAIMDAIPLVRGRVSDEQYRLELTAHPPALVVLWPDAYPRRQKAVLEEFLKVRGYVSSAIDDVPVAVRPDHIGQVISNRTPPESRASTR
jgi:hypothetical protein